MKTVQATKKPDFNEKIKALIIESQEVFKKINLQETRHNEILKNLSEIAELEYEDFTMDGCEEIFINLNLKFKYGNIVIISFVIDNGNIMNDVVYAIFSNDTLLVSNIRPFKEVIQVVKKYIDGEYFNE